MKMTIHEKKALFAFGCPSREATVQRLRLVADLSPELTVKKALIALADKSRLSIRLQPPYSEERRQKELLSPKQEVSALVAHRSLYRKTSITYTNNGKMARSQGQPLQSCAGCHFPPSAIEQRFTKKPSCCKRLFLQDCVRFCK